MDGMACSGLSGKGKTMSELQGVLRCPGCGAPVAPARGDQITCPYCAAVFFRPAPPPPPPQPDARALRMEARARIEAKKIEYRKAALEVRTRLREQREAERIHK